jgi:hypothetical protein
MKVQELIKNPENSGKHFKTFSNGGKPLTQTGTANCSKITEKKREPVKLSKKRSKAFLNQNKH